MTLTRRWWLPSLTAWLWFITLVVLFSAEWRTAMVSADGDTCMHWACGEWMLQQRHLLDRDVFSYTYPGEPIVSKEWLAQLVSAGAGRLDGLTGIAIWGALLIATTFALLHWQLVSEGNDLIVATLVSLLAAGAAQIHWIARPHLYTMLLLLLWNIVLRRYERGLLQRRELLLVLPLSMLLWVNLHGAFLVGFFTLGCYWLAAVFTRSLPKVRDYTLAGVLSVIASLVNPSGYQLHVHNFAFVQTSFFTSWLIEHMSPNFQSPGAFPFLLWLLILLLVLALARPQLAAHEILLLIMWGYFALYSGRNIPLFALLTAPFLARPISESLPGRLRRLTQRWQQFGRPDQGWPIVVLAAVALLFVPRTTELPAKDWPVKAVEFIHSHPERFTGNLFNQYAWGGYLLVALPEHKVFIDGRADFYGEAHVHEFDDITHLRPNWYELLEKHDVSWSLMPTDHYLNLALQLRGWEQVYCDPVATIYCR